MYNRGDCVESQDLWHRLLSILSWLDCYAGRSCSYRNQKVSVQPRNRLLQSVDEQRDREKERKKHQPVIRNDYYSREDLHRRLSLFSSLFAFISNDQDSSSIRACNS